MYHLLLSTTLAILVSLNTAYAASFNEIRDLIFNKNPVATTPEAQEEIEVYKSGKLPLYEVSTANFVKNGIDVLKLNAFRTINDHSDYYTRLEKLVHANGICFTGEWQMTEKSPYSGYFKQGSVAPIIARISTATGNTEKGCKRGFGLAVKLFPTRDLEEDVRTANIFTADVLTGTYADHFMDTTVTNEPSVGFNLFFIRMMLKLKAAFSAADDNPTYRPLYEVSEVGADSKTVLTPKWISIRPAPDQQIVDADDFRDELDMRNYPNGIILDVRVSDFTSDPEESDWRQIGKIVLKESAVSYGCDRQLHFPHPKMRGR